jgi:hypothetical protein
MTDILTFISVRDSRRVLLKPQSSLSIYNVNGSAKIFCHCSQELICTLARSSMSVTRTDPRPYSSESRSGRDIDTTLLCLDSPVTIVALEMTRNIQLKFRQ